MRGAKLGALVLLGVGLAGVIGPACSHRAEDPALNGEGVHGSVPAGQMTGGSGGMTGGGGGGTSTVGGGGGSGSGSGGGGTTVPCLENPGCMPKDAICGAGICIDEKCVFTAKPLASDRYGDCHKTLCDAQGKVIRVVDDTAPNVYDDGNPCTADTCMNGTPSNQAVSGSMCPLASGAKGICNPDGLCVGCLSEAQCKNSNFPICYTGKCVPLHCADKFQDDKETDVDCGGPDCAGCAGGRSCTQDSDCRNLSCDAKGDKFCHTPNCFDLRQNGAETSADCGGVDCGAMGKLCSDQAFCALPTDCKSGVCKAGFCQAPSCTDGVKNGTETGIDCGGVCGAIPCLPPL